MQPLARVNVNIGICSKSARLGAAQAEQRGARDKAHSRVSFGGRGNAPRSHTRACSCRGKPRRVQRTPGCPCCCCPCICCMCPLGSAAGACAHKRKVRRACRRREQQQRGPDVAVRELGARCDGVERIHSHVCAAHAQGDAVGRTGMVHPRRARVERRTMHAPHQRRLERKRVVAARAVHGQHVVKRRRRNRRTVAYTVAACGERRAKQDARVRRQDLASDRLVLKVCGPRRARPDPQQQVLGDEPLGRRARLVVFRFSGILLV